MPERETSSVPIFRVCWGLGRYEDFATPEEAERRNDELHAYFAETWPELLGTNDAVLPRIVTMESNQGKKRMEER